jgi:exodeoxyribonuclease VII small subunit
MSGNGVPAQDAGFEELTAALEEVLEQLERGDLSLDAALATYQRGVELVRSCNDLLDRAELRVSELAASAAPGEFDAPSRPGQQLFPFGRDDDEA